MKAAIYLRPLKMEDADTSYKWRNLPELWKHSKFRPSKPITLEIEQQWLSDCLKRDNEYRRAICIKETDEYIGNVQIVDISDSKGIFHLFIGEPQHWGKGIGKEATKQILDIGFNQLGLDLIWLEVHVDNHPAQHIYKKLGFLEGYVDGSFKAMALSKRDYSLVNSQRQEELTNT